MVKDILFSTIHSRAGFSLQNLRVIIEVHGIPAVLIDIVERGSVKRHGVDAGLIRGRTAILAFHRTPNLGSSRRPLAADVRTIFCGDAQACHFIPRARKPAALILIELHFVNVALIVHVHNRGTVARNGELGDGLRCESRIVPGNRIRLTAGSALLLFTRFKRIAVVIRIFLPMDHGIADLLRFPLRGKREVAGNGRVAEVKRGFAVQPACKRIPCTRGRRGFGDLRAVLHIEDGAHIAAAVRVERNGVGVAGVIHRDHRTLRRNHSARHGARRGAAFIGLCNRGHSRARLRAESLFCFLDEAAVDLLDVVLHRIARILYGIGDGNGNAAGRHCAGNGFLARFHHVSLNFRGSYAVFCANGKHRFIRSAERLAAAVHIMNGKRCRRGCELRRYLRVCDNGGEALVPADKLLIVVGFVDLDCRLRFCRDCGIRVFGDLHREAVLSYHERNGVFRCRLLCRLRRLVTCRGALLLNVARRRFTRRFAFGHVDDRRFRVPLSKRKFAVAEERAAKHDKRQQHCKRFFELVHTISPFRPLP